MADRGRKAKPDNVKFITGNPGNQQLSDLKEDFRAEPLVPPDDMRERARKYWDMYIEPAWWLTQADTQKEFAWCNLAADFEMDPTGCPMSKVNSCRHLGSELGFDPGSRAKFVGSGGGKRSAGSEFFD